MKQSLILSILLTIAIFVINSLMLLIASYTYIECILCENNIIRIFGGVSSLVLLLYLLNKQYTLFKEL